MTVIHSLGVIVLPGTGKAYRGCPAKTIQAFEKQKLNTFRKKVIAWHKQFSTGCRNLTKPLAVETGSESARESRRMAPTAG